MAIRNREACAPDEAKLLPDVVNEALQACAHDKLLVVVLPAVLESAAAVLGAPTPLLLLVLLLLLLA